LKKEVGKLCERGREMTGCRDWRSERGNERRVEGVE